MEAIGTQPEITCNTARKKSITWVGGWSMIKSMDGKINKDWKIGGCIGEKWENKDGMERTRNEEGLKEGIRTEKEQGKAMQLSNARV